MNNLLNSALNISCFLDCSLSGCTYRCNWGSTPAFSAVVKIIRANYLFFKRCAAPYTFWRKIKHILTHSIIIIGSSLAVSFLVQYPHTVQYWNSVNRSFSSSEWHSGHLFKKSICTGSFFSPAIFVLVIFCIINCFLFIFHTQYEYLLHYTYRFSSSIMFLVWV